MNHKFKMRQRVTALCMAAMMCCGMLPYEALAEDSARPVVVATVPILCIYPFLQKYFAAGVMIGAVKE